MITETEPNPEPNALAREAIKVHPDLALYYTTSQLNVRLQVAVHRLLVAGRTLEGNHD
jgi:hypothetical protein